MNKAETQWVGERSLHAVPREHADRIQIANRKLTVQYWVRRGRRREDGRCVLLYDQARLFAKRDCPEHAMEPSMRRRLQP